MLRESELQVRTANLSKSGTHQLVAAYRGKNGYVEEGWKFKPGFLYSQVRAITARINQNYDGWPSEELKKSYRTFVGKPIFVNHNNSDPKAARGKVIAARYYEAGDDKGIETIMEVDAQRFPKLAKEIREGGLDSVSMGVEAGFTICSFCDNKAVDDKDFCTHVTRHKGQILRKGSQDVLVYEKCYKLGFFELSYVFDPADETAVVSRVVQANRNSSRRHGFGEVEAPKDVDTLRNEGEDEDDDFHHYVETDPALKEPDMDRSKQLDREQEDQGMDPDRNSEDVENLGPEGPVDDQGHDDPDAGDADGGDTGSIDDVVEDFIDYCVSSDQPPNQDALDDYANNVGMDDQDYSDISDFLAAQDHDSQGVDTTGGDQAGPQDPSAPGGGFGGPPVDAAPPQAPPSQNLPPDPEDDPSQQQIQSRRRPVQRGRSAQKTRGGNMSGLSQRGRVATRGRYAADNGYTDGGPYGTTNDLGEQADAFALWAEVPGTEPVVAPDGDSKINNTESNLVESARRATYAAQQAVARLSSYQRWAAENGVAEHPDTVDPSLSGTDDQSLKGDDWQDVDLHHEETQPSDSHQASRQAFAAFETWLQRGTGRTAAQHGNANYIRRQAARWAHAQGLSLEVLFPTLGNVLRQARKSEGRRANVRRYAEDDNLDYAAPDDRADVQAPTANTTDAEAQASQFDLQDFGHNAGDGVADPDLTTDSQIWTPGDAPATKESRRTNAATACRYAQAVIDANLAPEADRWKIIAQAEAMRHVVVADRTRVLEDVVAVQQRNARKVAAGSSRGTGQSLPRISGGGSPRTASARVANNDPNNDALLFLK